MAWLRASGRCAAVISVALALTCSSASALAEGGQWPVQDAPIRVMNTLSTFQLYGSRPGFHHGLDLKAPAGTAVVAPVSGEVSTGYYYRRKSPYTYEVAIATEGGRRWELHHLAPDTVPASVERRAAGGGTVEAGEVVGRIYDAAEMGMTPHVHVNVIGPDGYYLNPLRFLPPLEDQEGPVIRGVYLVDGDDHARSLDSTTRVQAGSYQLVIDAFDRMPGETPRQAVYGLEVIRAGERLWRFRFDRLPDKDFLQGVSDIYRLEPIHLAEGREISTRLDDEEGRRFLYSTALSLFEEGSAGQVTLRIRASDLAGNATEALFELEGAR